MLISPITLISCCGNILDLSGKVKKKQELNKCQIFIVFREGRQYTLTTGSRSEDCFLAEEVIAHFILSPRNPTHSWEKHLGIIKQIRNSQNSRKILQLGSQQNVILITAGESVQIRYRDGSGYNK